MYLAGSFAFSPTFTFAAQESTEEENIEKIDLQTLSLTDGIATEESDIKTEDTPVKEETKQQHGSSNGNAQEKVKKDHENK